MASVTARGDRGGSVTWRVQFRIAQEGFARDDAVHKFAKLVDRVGCEAACATRRKRNETASPHAGGPHRGVP
jgi:hypothetical protein